MELAEQVRKIATTEDEQFREVLMAAAERLDHLERESHRMRAANLYAAMCAFADATGWYRYEGGWYTNGEGGDACLGEIVEDGLSAVGIDLRVPPKETA